MLRSIAPGGVFAMVLLTSGAPWAAPASTLASPQWTPAESLFFVTLPGRTATVQARFTPIPGAARYQVLVTDDRGQPVTDRAVEKSARRVTLPDVSPGRYRATVTAVGDGGAATAPSPALEFLVTSLKTVPGAPGLIPQGTEPSALPGTTFAAPAGTTCSAPGGDFGARVVLVLAGDNNIVCRTADGLSTASVRVLVQPITVHRLDDRPLFPGQTGTIELSLESPVPVAIESLDLLAPPGVTLSPPRRIDSAPAPGAAAFAVDVSLSDSTLEDVALLVERAGAPLTEVVLKVLHDTTPPTITNVDITVNDQAHPGLIVTAQVADNVAVGTVRVGHRVIGTQTYDLLPLSPLAPPTYGATIPIPAGAVGIEYFLEATDAGQNGPTRVGSEAAPLTHRLAAPPTAGLPPWWAFAPLGVAGTATAVGVVFVGSLFYGAWAARDADARLATGELSPAAHAEFQARARAVALLDVVGLSVSTVVVVLSGVSAAGLWLASE